jgi:hypothetical protein
MGFFSREGYQCLLYAPQKTPNLVSVYVLDFHKLL